MSLNEVVRQRVDLRRVTWHLAPGRRDNVRPTFFRGAFACHALDGALHLLDTWVLLIEAVSDRLHLFIRNTSRLSHLADACAVQLAIHGVLHQLSSWIILLDT